MHDTLQPFQKKEKKDAVLVQCLDSVPPVPPFSWGPSWECDHYLVLKTKSKKASWIVMVPWLL